MRKEVFLAILIGAALGGLIAFGVWRANLSLNKNLKNPTTGSGQLITDNREQTPEELTISEPEEGTISSSDKVTIKGSAKPGSIVAILASLENTIIEVKADGTFEAEVKLEGGVNEIKVTSVDQEGKESTKTMIVVYSTEFDS